MSKRWIAALILAGLVTMALAGAWLMRGKLATAAMEKIYLQAMARDPYAGLPDGLHVGLCGSG